MSAILNLSYLSVILVVGVLAMMLSSKLKIPNIIVLLLTGLGLGSLTYHGSPLFKFSPEFFASLAVVAIAIIVFDGSARLKMREFDEFAGRAFRLVLISLVMGLVLGSLITALIFHFSVYPALIFSGLMIATAPEIAFQIFGKTKNKVVEILEIEAIINTPLIVLLPFLFIDFEQTVGMPTLTNILDQILPFLQQLVAGIGAGVLMGIIIFKALKHYYSETISPIAILAGILLTYALAENLGGNGVLAVTTLGLLFGTARLREKTQLEGFSTVFSTLLYIIVIVLSGFLFNLSLGKTFYIKALIVYAGFLVIRLLSSLIAFGKYFKLREHMFISLVSPKGVAVASVVLVFATISFPNVSEVIALTLTIMLYSIIVSSIILKLSKPFIHTKVGE